MIGARRRSEEIAVPPTIQALLQARLDRLGSEERDVIGRGSVEGQVFHRGVVQELATESERNDIPAHLLTLVRKDVIRPDRATFADDEAFRFRHLLIRDAAYDALPKETRAELHERFADWLDGHAALVEQDEIVGYHLERAHRNRAELDSADPRLDALARRAATTLAAASRGAEARGDHGAMCGLVLRAIALLPEGDPQRLELMVGLAVPFNERGSAGRSPRAVGRAPGLARRAVPGVRPARRRSSTMRSGLNGSPSAASATSPPRGRSSTVSATSSGWRGPTRQSGAFTGWACRTVPAGLAAERAEAHARAAGERDARRGNEARRAADACLRPGSRGRGNARAERDAGRGAGEVGRAHARRNIAKLLAMRGEFEAAREHVYAGNRDVFARRACSSARQPVRSRSRSSR